MSQYGDIPGRQAETTECRDLTFRAVVLGLICAAVACVVVAWAELIVTQMQIGFLQFAPAAVGLLLVIVLVNLILRKFTPRLALILG